MLDDGAGAEAIDSGYRGLRGALAAVRTARRIKPLMADVLRDLGHIARTMDGGVDVVVHGPSLPAQHVAELLGVPSVLATLQPGWVPSSVFPCAMIPLPRLPKVLNKSTYLAVSAALRAYRGITTTWRENDLGLPCRSGAHDLLREPDGHHRVVLQAYSPLITPTDPAWSESVHTTGFWRLPTTTSWTPPAELARFLRDGPAPVYVGFGSMAGRDAHRTGRIVAEAVRITGVRAILATGWGGITPATMPENTLVIQQAPHDWLLPRTAAIVHHGGGGTTAAALAAGRPQVLCPFVADQPHWAQRMHLTGVAPAPIPQRQLSPEPLATAITEATTNATLRERATVLGKAIRAENGTRTAIDVLEALLGAP